MYSATRLSKWILLCLYLSQYAFARRILDEPRIHFLNADDSVQNNHPGLKTYCHNATSKYLTHMWRTMTMHLNINSDSYILYDGKTPQEIHQKYDENDKSWSLNLFDTGKHRQFKINPFEDTCIGIYIDSPSESIYIMTLKETRINVWRLTLMVTGIIIFWCAKILSRNSLFYYACGIILGVSLSIIILIYVAGKLIPRGKTMYVIFAASMSLYIAKTLWENMQLIIMQYREWVMWYVLVTSLISFVICYRFGPVTNTRTKQIIEWFLQLVGLALIYHSSHFHEASFSCCIIVIFFYNFPKTAFGRAKRYWQHVFPEKRKLINEDQYRQEGIRQTRKALKGLQNYCSSPECNPWKTVLKLKDPIRFARFMEGESHLLEDEIEEHEEETSKILEKGEYTDDDDDSF
ncbi:PREDICTED: nuclear envelope integral membrane protein 1 isoform X1 [Trachymyrmex septentrionalis]|uniref:nuclear envelope integral membrane protein 1 isoform X1 n=1 Tax=Trachymyrmex septentrionalis TaxID=34720 RepID=UPI00084F3298|nr:PREDICTED: nuclear envelope integral membrane protein 1 isoform X1 [Trachymyrmex septentrionalis]